MRIISGTARGTKLYTLEGLETRPTLDRIKESLFSIIQEKIEKATVLDLFAGSGALGLEALSRGAKKALLCDKSYKAISIIQQNVEKTKMQDKAMIKKAPYIKVLQELKQNDQRYDIIFLDPPYKKDILVDAVKRIMEYEILQEDGIIIAETDEEQIVNQIKETNSNIYDIRKYGRVILVFLNRKG